MNHALEKRALHISCGALYKARHHRFIKFHFAWQPIKSRTLICKRSTDNEIVRPRSAVTCELRRLKSVYSSCRRI